MEVFETTSAPKEKNSMIAVITSCINPFNPLDNTLKSSIDLNARFSQTLETINELSLQGFRKIYLIDNSHSFNLDLIPEREMLVKKQVSQYQFKNKGINELLMLLYIVDELPEDETIFKISGRYRPNAAFKPVFDINYDFKVKGYDYNKSIGNVSTRGYFVKDKNLYKEFLLKCLNEIFIYSYRIVGIRSAIKAFKDLLSHKIPLGPNTSIEVAFAKVFKACGYKVELVDLLGIEGKIAGFEPVEKIVE